MSDTLQFNTEEMRLTPVLFKEPQGKHGTVTHAAFSVKLRFSFTVNIPSVVIDWATDLITLVKEKLNSTFTDPSSVGSQLPTTMGIPTAYASTYEELYDFLGFDTATIFEPKLTGAMFVFANKNADACSASSMTLRYGSQSFARSLSGNYRSMEISCVAGDVQPESSVLKGILHLERATLAMELKSPEILRKSLGVELTHGSIELEFIMIDQRKRASN